MWPFNGLKSVRGLRGADRIELSEGGQVSLDEVMATFSQIGKDIGVLTQACQRIEKKQLRWLELLNIKDETSLLPSINQSGPDEVANLASQQTGEEPALAGVPTEE